MFTTGSRVKVVSHSTLIGYGIVIEHTSDPSGNHRYIVEYDDRSLTDVPAVQVYTADLDTPCPVCDTYCTGPTCSGCGYGEKEQDTPSHYSAEHLLAYRRQVAQETWGEW